jgi:hypothetical protein
MSDSILKSKSVKFRAELLVREILSNNTRLIANSDRKARILIIFNVTIISILISSYSMISNTKVSQAPLIIVMISNCLCLLLSIRSVGQMRKKVNMDLDYTNWLDYSVFRSMEVDVFVRTLQDKLADKRNVFKLALIELYGQGQLLNQKNFFINSAFVCLGIGLNLALLITLIEIVFGPVK